MPHEPSDRQGTHLYPIGLDGEPVTDPRYALPAPADFRPWEEVVAAYLATWTTDRRPAA